MAAWEEALSNRTALGAAFLVLTASNPRQPLNNG